MNGGILQKMGLKNSPNEAEPASEKLRDDCTVVFDTDLCVVCGLCARHCPQNAISMLDSSGIRSIIRDHEKCKTCLKCVDICQIAGGSKRSENFKPSENNQIDAVSSELISCVSCGKPIGTHLYLEHLCKVLGAQTFSNRTLLSFKLISSGVITKSTDIQKRNPKKLEILCHSCRSFDSIHL